MVKHTNEKEPIACRCWDFLTLCIYGSYIIENRTFLHLNSHFLLSYIDHLMGITLNCFTCLTTAIFYLGYEIDGNLDLTTFCLSTLCFSVMFNQTSQYSWHLKLIRIAAPRPQKSEKVIQFSSMLPPPYCLEFFFCFYFCLLILYWN